MPFITMVAIIAITKYESYDTANCSFHGIRGIVIFYTEIHIITVAAVMESKVL